MQRENKNYRNRGRLERGASGMWTISPAWFTTQMLDLLVHPRRRRGQVIGQGKLAARLPELRPNSLTREQNTNMSEISQDTLRQISQNREFRRSVAQLYFILLASLLVE
jgi:hypothetical protein